MGTRQLRIRVGCGISGSRRRWPWLATQRSAESNQHPANLDAPRGQVGVDGLRYQISVVCALQVMLDLCDGSDGDRHEVREVSVCFTCSPFCDVRSNGICRTLYLLRERGLLALERRGHSIDEEREFVRSLPDEQLSEIRHAEACRGAENAASSISRTKHRIHARSLEREGLEPESKPEPKPSFAQAPLLARDPGPGCSTDRSFADACVWTSAGRTQPPPEHHEG